MPETNSPITLLTHDVDAIASRLTLLEQQLVQLQAVQAELQDEITEHKLEAEDL